MMYGAFATQDADLRGRYIIWSPGASQPPKMTYADRPTAIKVAHKMAAEHPGQQFTVCKIVGSARTVKAQYESYED